MHGSEYHSCVVDLALDVSGPVIPVHFQVFDWKVLIGLLALSILRMEELHDSCQIVRFSGRFAYQVNVI